MLTASRSPRQVPLILQTVQLTPLLILPKSLSSRLSQAWRAEQAPSSLLKETQAAPGVDRPSRIQLSREALLYTSSKKSRQNPDRLHSREEEAEGVASLPLHNTRREYRRKRNLAGLGCMMMLLQS